MEIEKFWYPPVGKPGSPGVFIPLLETGPLHSYGVTYEKLYVATVNPNLHISEISVSVSVSAEISALFHLGLGLGRTEIDLSRSTTI